MPFGSWEGVRSAEEDRSECFQDNVDKPSITEGGEDCLFVNVYTKHAGEVDAKRPVLVWIHGGAFIFGANKIYGPKYIMEEDVVLVVINYRLNIFGFLSTEDEAGPGNYGMHDQVEALK